METGRDAAVPGDHGAHLSRRDALRSARRWQELLSSGERRRLLLDIARVALAVGQDLYAERGVSDLDLGARRDGDACPRERLAFLADAWPRVARALHAVETAPHTVSVPHTRPVATPQARRVSPMAVLRAVRSDDWVPAPTEGGDGPLAERLGGRLPRRVHETVCASSVDTPENRAVKAALVHFARDLRAVTGVAQAVGAADEAEEAERLRARVRRHLVRDPWRDLPLPARLDAPSPTTRAHPYYRLIHDTYRRYRQSFRFDWDNPLFTLPARETWLLYEYWGFFQVAGVLREMGWRASAATGFALQRSGLRFRLAKGEASRIDFVDANGRALSLWYTREFPRAGAKDSEGWRSRSHAMRPDVTVESAGRLLILDPKFKTFAKPGWEADDVHQMHAYRDAVTGPGDERGVVRAAWLLYAGSVGGANRPVIAYPKSTTARPFGAGEVGALLLRPGGDQGRLAALLARFLEL